MTIDEAKQLEVKIANNILNNIPFAQVVQILSNEATRRSKEAVDNASEEELVKMKEDFEKAEAEIAAQQAQTEPAASEQTQEKIDLPDDDSGDGSGDGVGSAPPPTG
jgi:hypothetical protein